MAEKSAKPDIRLGSNTFTPAKPDKRAESEIITQPRGPILIPDENTVFQLVEHVQVSKPDIKQQSMENYPAKTVKHKAKEAKLHPDRKEEIYSSKKLPNNLTTKKPRKSKGNSEKPKTIEPPHISFSIDNDNDAVNRRSDYDDRSYSSDDRINSESYPMKNPQEIIVQSSQFASDLPTIDLVYPTLVMSEEEARR